jgi:hypothetical protein
MPVYLLTACMPIKCKQNVGCIEYADWHSYISIWWKEESLYAAVISIPSTAYGI